MFLLGILCGPWPANVEPVLSLYRHIQKLTGVTSVLWAVATGKAFAFPKQLVGMDKCSAVCTIGEKLQHNEDTKPWGIRPP